ncbi:MAG: hypothetical protein OXR66_04845 [Candidatus Woesearchaeota archaeon]|nr:hypothetical protein [Candidatus Woesearchaeota archaeon]
MNKKILNIIKANKDLFVPAIFTAKQFATLQKKRLTATEKKAYYTSIKKKLAALACIEGQNYFITGAQHIKRYEQAQEILEQYKQYDNVFIGGSFLFAKNYNDIDIFILRKRGYKEERRGNHHIIFLTEKQLRQPLFQSIARISVSTFPLLRVYEKKKPKLADLMSMYHEAIIEHMQKHQTDARRTFIFQHFLHCKGKLLHPKRLEHCIRRSTANELDCYMKELCSTLFSQTYLYVDLQSYIKTITATIQHTKPNRHLRRYKATYEELIYGRRKETST